MKKIIALFFLFALVACKKEKVETPKPSFAPVVQKRINDDCKGEWVRDSLAWGYRAPYDIPSEQEKLIITVDSFFYFIASYQLQYQNHWEDKYTISNDTIYTAGWSIQYECDSNLLKTTQVVIGYPNDTTIKWYHRN